MRAPSRAMTLPLGIPKIAIGAISAARTNDIFDTDPVVVSTNQGSATKVIWMPVIETSSATSSASVVRFLSIGAIINKTSVRFCKIRPCRNARKPTSRPAATADPRRRAPRVLALRVRGRDGREAGAGDRALARRDLQLLPEKYELFFALASTQQAEALEHLEGAGVRGAAAGDRRGESRLARRLPRARAASAHRPRAPRTLEAADAGRGPRALEHLEALQATRRAARRRVAGRDRRASSACSSTASRCRRAPASRSTSTRCWG